MKGKLLYRGVGRAAYVGILLSVLVQSPGLHAAENAPAVSARQKAPYDLTGYWVAVVTEDWRWRMMTPARGDYASIPMTPAAMAVADQWDMQKDVAEGNACRPFGAGGIMRVPTRLHIEWMDDNTLRIDTDAGTQTRLFHFAAFDAERGQTWQGNSTAVWDMVDRVRGDPQKGGSLKAVTSGLKPGYVRWNGVPYSGNAVVTEYFDRHAAFGQEWFTVTTIVEDPLYFTVPYIVSSHFRREENAARWNPTPCFTDAPVSDAVEIIAR